MTVDAGPRASEHWVEDLVWHRRGFAQSYFRWAPEDPMSIALTWTRGRLLHETVRDLEVLSRQLRGLRAECLRIDASLAANLREAQQSLGERTFATAVLALDLTLEEATTLSGAAETDDQPHRDVVRATRGIPFTNPLTRAWELRQLRLMYAGAENLMEDTVCDLVWELTPPTPVTVIAQAVAQTPYQLWKRLHTQRAERGEAGDPRRVPEQTFDPVPTGLL